MANAKIEVGVQLVQRWIVARLQERRFFSLAQLNAAIRELLKTFNGKVTRHLGATRRELFKTLDRPALKPLPLTSMPNGSSERLGSTTMSRSPSTTARFTTPF
ncbi:MAG: hypothetical protein AAFY66_07580 [Pseudomonadota bacterium]